MMYLKRRLLWIRRRYSKALLIGTAIFIAAGYFFYNDASGHRYKDIESVKMVLQETLKYDKGTGCEMPELDPFAKEIMNVVQNMTKIVCTGKDWVKCHNSSCRIDPKLLESVGNDSVICAYKDIVFRTDKFIILKKETVLEGNKVYTLNRSDHVRIKCNLTSTAASAANNFSYDNYWDGVGTGYRPLLPVKPPPGRENTLNVLMFLFDSTSKNGFIRQMPKSYRFIKEDLGAVILNKYNTVGDGTRNQIIPIFTGKMAQEIGGKSKFLDNKLFIFDKLKKDGYRTAYYEDTFESTFTSYYAGFGRPLTDHYLTAFFNEEENLRHETNKTAQFCVGDTPTYQIMINITEQFLKFSGKRFSVTFVSDISHDYFQMISNADEALVQFLQGLIRDGHLKNTLLMVMGDHGQRFGNERGIFQIKLEERAPFMAIRLPEDLISKRPDVVNNLKNNVNTLTTPFDVYATLLDVVDMKEHWDGFKIKGADLKRSMSLLEPISRSRSCSEAGVLPHYCNCLKWEMLPSEDSINERIAQALVNRINQITEFQRSNCVVRYLKSINWVMKQPTNRHVTKGVLYRVYDALTKFMFGQSKTVYQVRITSGPGNGSYEAIVTHLINEDKFYINTEEISRTTAYGDEPKCVADNYPDMVKYCYCKS